MKTVDDVFDAFEGKPSVLGRAIGISTEHAAAMRRRGSIPVRYWRKLVAAAGERGNSQITFEALAELHAEPIRAAG